MAASSAAASDTELVPSSGFRIEQISFGKILSPIGIGLMSYGFGAFFGLLPGGDISSIMLIYGFPISLLGFALAYAQLKPVPCKTTRAAFDLRDTQMTDIQKQVRGLPIAASNNFIQHSLKGTHYQRDPKDKLVCSGLQCRTKLPS